MSVKLRMLASLEAAVANKQQVGASALATKQVISPVITTSMADGTSSSEAEPRLQAPLWQCYHHRHTVATGGCTAATSYMQPTPEHV